MAASAPRTLADQLRGWSDEELARLLSLRPDLASPPPQDSAQLASRASTRASVQRALDDLTSLELTVLDAVVSWGGVASAADVERAVNGAAGPALDRVRAAVLVWGSDEELRLVNVAADALGTSISGLGSSMAQLLGGYGPTRVATLARALGLSPSGDRAGDIAAIADELPRQVPVLVAELDDRARAILDHLESTGQDGRAESTEHQADRGAAVGPVDQLLARGLVLARDRRHVAVPREVAIALRGGTTSRAPADAVPALATTEREPAAVDRVAAGAASDVVRQVELLLEHWGSAPPAMLRGGGLGVRELKAAAGLAHVEERVAALLLETASAAGLLAAGSTEDDAVWLPTDAFDTWTQRTSAQRWVTLAAAWLGSPRLSALVGTRQQGKTVNALAPELERTWLVDTRRRALDELATVTPGFGLAAGTGIASLVERLRWLRPRRPAERARAVGWAIDEAAALGLVGLGALASYARTLLNDHADNDEGAAAELAPLLPEPVGHVLLQADLTAIAPGPLEQRLAGQLAALAGVESRGGATVYRFSEASVRHAFDVGWSATEVHEFLAAASLTPVPQPLSFLVDDVARRFGTVRVGTAESFVRSDDEPALLALMGRPELRLRRIAPTVLVSDVPVDVLLGRLRAQGAAPVLEAADGTVHLTRRPSLRTRTPRARRTSESARDAARVSAAVTAIRAGDRAARLRPATARPASPAATLALLRSAAENGSTVWISYVDNAGATVERVVEPVRVEGGWLSAYDPRHEEVRSFAVHRITTVSVQS